jgi:tetratricopeptide (TPR) repeat protein
VTLLDRYVSHPDPKVATAHSKLGQALWRLGDAKNAEIEFGRAVKLFEQTLGPGAPDTTYARNWLEGVRAKGGTPAPWIITEVLTPETIMRDSGKALIYEVAHHQVAEERLREAAQGGDSAALFHLWELLKDDPDRKEEAARLLQRAVEAKVPKALYWRGRQLVEEPGREAEAERLVRAAIDAGETYSWYDLGLLLERDPARREEAERAFRAAIDAGHEEARNDLGLMLLKVPGRESDGEEMLKETGRRGQARSFHNLAIHLSEQGRDSDAIEAFQNALAGGYRGSHLDLGLLLDRCGRRQAAEQEFCAAVAAGDPRGYLNLGVLCDMEGRIEEAERVFRAAMNAKVRDAARLLGNVLLRMPGRERESAGCFLQMAHEGNPEGWLRLATVADEVLGDYALSEEAYRSAIAAGLAKGWNNLGILLSRLGCVQDAEQAFLEAIRTGHPEGWHNLAVHLEDVPGRQVDAAFAAELAEIGAGPEVLGRWTTRLGASG